MFGIINSFVNFLINDTKINLLQWIPLSSLSYDGYFDYEDIFIKNPAFMAWRETLLFTKMLDSTFFSCVQDGFVFIQEKSKKHSIYSLYIQPTPTDKIVLTACDNTLLKTLYETIDNACPITGDVERIKDFMEIYVFSHNKSSSDFDIS